jgi:hypothetical protein
MRRAIAKAVIGLFDDLRQTQHIVQAPVDDGMRRADRRRRPGGGGQAYTDDPRRGGC